MATLPPAPRAFLDLLTPGPPVPGREVGKLAAPTVGQWYSLCR